MKQIIVLGGIGQTERKNRDDFRVLHGGYINYVASAFKCGTSVSGEEMGKQVEKKMIVLGGIGTWRENRENKRVLHRGGASCVLRAIYARRSRWW